MTPRNEGTGIGLGLPKLTSSTVRTEERAGEIQDQQRGIPNLSPPGPQQYQNDGILTSTPQYFQDVLGGANPLGELLPPGIKDQGQDRISSENKQYQQNPQDIPIDINQSGNGY